MQQESEDSSEFEVKAGDKSARARTKHMAELIAILALVLLAVVSYGGLLHMQDTRESNRATVQALEKITEKNADSDAKLVKAIREQTCYFILPENERKSDFQSPYGVCKRVAQ